MKRIYTNNGQGISTKITNVVDGKKYIVSTAKDPRGFWQLAVFKTTFGMTNPYKPERVGDISKTFEEAERKHFETEDLVTNTPHESWRNWT